MNTSQDASGAIIDSLKSLGLTKYEALVYIALLKVEGASATEIHEISGVPRASVYPVLDRLLQKNLVNVAYTTPRRFGAAPPDDGINLLLSQIKDDAEYARSVLNEYYQERIHSGKGKQELIWSITGEENIRTHLQDILSKAEISIRMISNWNFIRAELLSILLDLNEGMEVEIITDTWEAASAPHLHVITKPYHKRVFNAFEGKEMAGFFIIDEKKVMVLMGLGDVTPTALYSESPGFIDFFSRYWAFIQEVIKGFGHEG